MANALIWLKRMIAYVFCKQVIGATCHASGNFSASLPWGLLAVPLIDFVEIGFSAGFRLSSYHMRSASRWLGN
jgi:hypothetical protein